VAIAAQEVIVLPEVESAASFPDGEDAWGRINERPYELRGWCAPRLRLASFGTSADIM